MKNGKQIQPSTYLIIAFGVLLLIIVGVIVLFYTINNNSDSSTADVPQNEYVDPGSGETIVNPEGKSPETANINPNVPTYIGFSNLYNYGLQQDAVENIKAFINDYADQKIVDNEEKIKEVSLEVASIKHVINRDVNENSYTFKITVNRKEKLNVKIAFEGVITMTNTLYKTDIAQPLLVKTYDL
jgi:hypothetical protein